MPQPPGHRPPPRTTSLPSPLPPKVAPRQPKVVASPPPPPPRNDSLAASAFSPPPGITSQESIPVQSPVVGGSNYECSWKCSTGEASKNQQKSQLHAKFPEDLSPGALDRVFWSYGHDEGNAYTEALVKDKLGKKLLEDIKSLPRKTGKIFKKATDEEKLILMSAKRMKEHLNTFQRIVQGYGKFKENDLLAPIQSAEKLYNQLGILEGEVVNAKRNIMYMQAISDGLASDKDSHEDFKKNAFEIMLKAFFICKKCVEVTEKNKLKYDGKNTLSNMKEAILALLEQPPQAAVHRPACAPSAPPCEDVDLGSQEPLGQKQALVPSPGQLAKHAVAQSATAPKHNRLYPQLGTVLNPDLGSQEPLGVSDDPGYAQVGAVARRVPASNPYEIVDFPPPAQSARVAARREHPYEDVDFGYQRKPGETFSEGGVKKKVGPSGDVYAQVDRKAPPGLGSQGQPARASAQVGEAAKRTTASNSYENVGLGPQGQPDRVSDYNKVSLSSNRDGKPLTSDSYSRIVMTANGFFTTNGATDTTVSEEAEEKTLVVKAENPDEGKKKRQVELKNLSEPGKVKGFAQMFNTKS